MPQTFWEKLMVAPSVLLCSFDVWAAASVLIFKSTLFNELEWPRLLCLFLWVHLPLCPPPPFWRSFSSASFHQLGSGTFRPSSSSLFCGSCWQKQPLTSSSNYSHWSKYHSKNGQASFQIRCKAITHARPMVSKFFDKCHLTENWSAVLRWPSVVSARWRRLLEQPRTASSSIHRPS